MANREAWVRPKILGRAESCGYFDPCENCTCWCEKHGPDWIDQRERHFCLKCDTEHSHWIEDGYREMERQGCIADVLVLVLIIVVLLIVPCTVGTLIVGR